MMITARIEGDTLYMTGTGCDRTATVTRRDATSYVVAFSNGRMAGGEAPFHFWERMAFDWVFRG